MVTGFLTSTNNLGALCRRHHRMKHQLPGLRLEQDDGAVFRWTTPAGRTYTVQYSDVLGPAQWRNLAIEPARTNARVITVLDPAVRPNRHYRMVTPAQP